MRQTSKVQVTVRGVVIGGGKPLICLPLMGDKKEIFLQEAEELVALQADLLEWRVDGYERVEDIKECLSALSDLRVILGDIPLIFTCRISQEGGIRELPQEKRLELFCAAIESGNVDIVDIELCNQESFIQAVIECCRDKGVKVILSYHNFKETPSEQFLGEKLLQAQTAGAEIAKLAVMPETYGDVLTLLTATNNARNETIQGPMVIISMGVEGAISRLAGGLFGSDITFAIGKEASAPGQLPIRELRAGMKLLFDNSR